MFNWLLNLLLRVLWTVGFLLVRGLITMSRWIPPSILLLLLLVVPLLGFSLPRLDRTGSYMMVVAAVVLAFIAGSMSRKRQ
jgi:hypothetical protein